MKALLALAFLVLGTSAVAAADPVAKETYTRSTITPSPVASDLSGPYIGAGIGYQMTDITLSSQGQEFSGIAADGYTFTGHAGWNFRVADSIYLAPEVELGISDASVELGGLGDVIELDSFGNLVVAAKYLVTPLTWFGPRAGYELQYWTAFGEDVETGWWLAGLELGSEIAPGVSLKLTADMLFLNSVNVDGLADNHNDDITDALDKTQAVRVQLRTSYRPPAPQSLSKMLGN